VSAMTPGELMMFVHWLTVRGLRANLDALRLAERLDEMEALADRYAAEFKRLGGNAGYFPPAHGGLR
jgi:hypothetical protein